LVFGQVLFRLSFNPFHCDDELFFQSIIFLPKFFIGQQPFFNLVDFSSLFTVLSVLQTVKIFL